MHSTKLEFAFSFFPKYELTQPFEIFDWGCGQGLASLEFLYFLQKNHINLPARVTLIEPSKQALGRAHINVQNILTDNAEIRTVNKLLPCNRLDDNIVDISIFSQCYPIIVHLFSNILDIVNINLKKIAEYITSQHILHYILCVGPCNAGESRIEAFSRYFYIDNSSVFANYRDAQFSHVRDYHVYTCFIKGFKADCRYSNEILCKFEYYPPIQYHCGYRVDILKNENISALCSLNLPYSFEILASFDFAASSCPDPHPIYAVLTNIISRGLPTRASPFLEKLFVRHLAVTREVETLGSIQFVVNEANKPTLEDKIFIAKVSLSVARVQKTIIEAIRFGELQLTQEWNILAIENDVPCSAIAFAELQQMWNNLTQLSEKFCDLTFPKINLYIVSPHYHTSQFHGNAKVYSNINEIDINLKLDIIFDISLDKLSEFEPKFLKQYQKSCKYFFIIRSSERNYSDRKVVTTERIQYKHVTDQSNIELLRYFLQLLFRKNDFRPGQLPILDRALRLKSVIGLLPTGGGKSLTYQLAAMLQPGVTLIVDPLMSLMKDQVDGLKKNGIDCCSYINSTLDQKEKERSSCMLADSELLFLFLSPERLCIQDFRIRLRDMSAGGVFFAYGVVDEVHCVSEWGHDFRLAYLHVGRNLYNYVLPKKTDGENAHISLFGLTATASFDVLADVERELSANNAFPLTPDATVRYENTNRLELQYRVIKIANNRKNPTKWDIYNAKAEAVTNIISNILFDSFQDLSKPDSISNIKKRFIERENIQDKDLINDIENMNISTNVNNDWYHDPDHSSAAIVFCPHRTGSIGVKDKKIKV